MESSLEKIGKAKYKIKIEYSQEEFKKAYKESIFILGKDLEISGFRKGKVPFEILEKNIGKEKILKETALRLIDEGYRKIILKENLEPIGEPVIKILKLSLGDSFIFEIETWIILPPNLPNYREIVKEIKRKKIEVEEKEVEETIIWLQKSRAKILPKREKAEEGDLVEIEYKSSEIEKGKVFEDRFVLGEGKLINNLESEILGMREGEEKKIKVSFPKDFKNEELRGKKVEIFLKLKKLFSFSLPEINDEFAKSLGNFQDLSDLKKSIQEGIKKEKELEEKKRIIGEILDKISQKTEVEIPEILIEKEKEFQLQNFKENILKSLKISFEDYLKKIGKSAEEIENYFYDLSKEFIKRSLILKEIARKEKIEASEEEIKERINQFLKRFKNVEEAEREVDLEKLKLYTEEEVRNDKVLNFLERLVPF